MAFSKKTSGANGYRPWLGDHSLLCPDLDKGGPAQSGKMKPAIALGFSLVAMSGLPATSLFGQSLQRLGDHQIVAQDANIAGYIVGGSGEQAMVYRRGQFFFLGTLPGHTRSFAEAISETGLVTGTSSTVESYRAFLYRLGRMVDLGTLGGTRSYGYAVNNWGEVAGQSTTAGDREYHGFLYSNGRMTDLGTLGGTSSSATGINDFGVVVGFSSIAGNQATHAFMFSRGEMTDLGTLGGSFSIASAINTLGQIAGTSATSSNTLHAFIHERGEMKDLGVLARTEHSDAFAINNSGQIVGRCYSSSGYEPAFLYSDGVMHDLNVLFEDLLSDGTTPGFVLLSEATSITDNGIIVGFGWYYYGEKKYDLAPFVLDTRRFGLNIFEDVTATLDTQEAPAPLLNGDAGSAGSDN
jgi:probable HAF family extracellular repeat protein